MPVLMTNWGDLLSALLTGVLALLCIYYGTRYHQPWKQAQGLMLVFLAVYFLLHIWDLHTAWASEGAHRLAFDLFCVFSIAHLLRFGLAKRSKGNRFG